MSDRECQNALFLSLSRMDRALQLTHMDETALGLRGRYRKMQHVHQARLLRRQRDDLRCRQVKSGSYLCRRDWRRRHVRHRSRARQPPLSERCVGCRCPDAAGASAQKPFVRRFKRATRFADSCSSTLTFSVVTDRRERIRQRQSADRRALRAMAAHAARPLLTTTICGPQA